MLNNSDAIIMPDDPRWLSAESCCFGRFASERAAAAARPVLTTRSAKRAAGHVRVQALKKRQAKRHEIANRPRGHTRAIDHRADGRPVYRAVPAFRARPYTPPGERKERPTLALATPHGIAAALKAEAPQRELGQDDPPVTWKHIRQRAARKVRMARIRRRGW